MVGTTTMVGIMEIIGIEDNRYRGTNVPYHRGRRSGVVNTNGRAHAAMIQSTKVKRRIVNNPDVVIDKELIIDSIP